jgi:CxxC-x17-CxxC domain-containing protein
MADFKLDSSGKPRGRPKKFAGRGGGRRDSGRSGSRDSGRSHGRSSDRFGGGNRGPVRKEMTTVTCDSCKERCEVPFRPTSNKPIYCDRCFRKESRSSGRSNSGGQSSDLAEINRKLDKIIEALELD